MYICSQIKNKKNKYERVPAIVVGILFFNILKGHIYGSELHDRRRLSKTCG